MSDEFVIRISVVSSLTLLILLIRSTYAYTSTLLTPGLIFLISFYLFQNGQILLYSLSVDFNTFYINKFGAKIDRSFHFFLY